MNPNPLSEDSDLVERLKRALEVQAAKQATNMGPPNASEEQRRQGGASSAHSNSRRQLLPHSAPVSSLLPPIPTTTTAHVHAHAHAHAHHPIHSQIIALLSNTTTRQPQQPPQPQPPQPPTTHTAFGQAAPTQHHNPLLAAAAAAATATATATNPLSSSNIQLVPPNIQNWSLLQLEKHVAMLQSLHQTVPQSVAMLLAEAKRREEKKNAKRLANRKSASSSRARKKALVKEMTELNARLKRQALILALLPDLVMVIDVKGVISFCSAQVERVLRRKIEDLVGAKLGDILVPSSRGKLKHLIKELTQQQQQQSSTSTCMPVGMEGSNLMSASPAETDTAPPTKPRKQSGVKRPRLEQERGPEGKDENDEGKRPAKGLKAANEKEGDSAPDAQSKEAAIVSETQVHSDPSSFPMSVVQVESTTAAVAAAAAAGSDENENSDLSACNGVGSKQMSSLTNSASITRSPTASSLGNSGSDGDGAAKKKDKEEGVVKKKGAVKKSKELPSSDTSNSSSLSTNAKKLQHANANLERNVRWHNRKLNKAAKKTFRDDVIGADVTANNASARLSSLRHRMESSSEEDSGYRESNDSREETSSSASDSSDNNGRRKPLAPTCNICLIRNDLTTIWCEVTSSVRTRSPQVEEFCTPDEDVSNKKPPPSVAEDTALAVAATREETEILLCLRPIRDGEAQVSKTLVASLGQAAGNAKKAKETKALAEVTSGTSGGGTTSEEKLSSSPSRPLKKRRPPNKEENISSAKRLKVNAPAPS